METYWFLRMFHVLRKDPAVENAVKMSSLSQSKSQSDPHKDKKTNTGVV